MKQSTKDKLLLKYVEFYLWLIKKQEERYEKAPQIIIDVQLMFEKHRVERLKKALEEEISELKKAGK